MVGPAAMIGAAVARDEAALRERVLGGADEPTPERVEAAMPASLDAVSMTYSGRELPCSGADFQRNREDRPGYKRGNPFQFPTRKFPLS